MQIYDVLKQDHDKLRTLLGQLVGSADADDQTRKKLIEQIRDEVVPHSRAEEAVFYNSLRSIDEAKDVIVHSYAEHMEAETLLRTLQGLEAADVQWTQIARKLKDSLEHHIEEEEGKVFSTAQQLLTEEEADLMAEAFERIKPEVRDESFVQTTLDMIANMMPARFAAPLRSFSLNP